MGCSAVQFISWSLRTVGHDGREVPIRNEINPSIVQGELRRSDRSDKCKTIAFRWRLALRLEQDHLKDAHRQLTFTRIKNNVVVERCDEKLQRDYGAMGIAIFQLLFFVAQNADKEDEVEQKIYGVYLSLGMETFNDGLSRTRLTDSVPVSYDRAKEQGIFILSQRNHLVVTLQNYQEAQKLHAEVLWICLTFRQKEAGSKGPVCFSQVEVDHAEDYPRNLIRLDQYRYEVHRECQVCCRQLFGRMEIACTKYSENDLLQEPFSLDMTYDEMVYRSRARPKVVCENAVILMGPDAALIPIKYLTATSTQPKRILWRFEYDEDKGEDALKERVRQFLATGPKWLDKCVQLRKPQSRKTKEARALVVPAGVEVDPYLP
ncbi:hypothetical protein BDV28DRAFT_66162 [Aspergillus coremiiformis]|uniref:Uncharacterized protein n=1 Tax=Aspergillus coremiiformis TaxID=138285 RepID=A0A5N6ZB96_9EURO|nr:hypothetical protein BDV28DRAFT_66162 [Aspergillus coremiiformis]